MTRAATPFLPLEGGGERRAGRAARVGVVSAAEAVVTMRPTTPTRRGCAASRLPPPGGGKSGGHALTRATAASTLSSSFAPCPRRLTSTVPAATPLGPTTTCHGTPIRSAVANFAPPRSSRSS